MISVMSLLGHKPKRQIAIMYSIIQGLYKVMARERVYGPVGAKYIHRILRIFIVIP